MYQELNYGAGFCKDQTQLAAKGRWYDGNYVRFRDGLPETIGGWSAQQLQDPLLSFNGGVPRALSQWSALDGTPIIAVGTNSALLLIVAGVVYDITPFAHISISLNNPITTTMGSSIITITDAGFSPVPGQAVVISGATAVGGIPAPAINQTLIVLTVPTGTTFTVDTGTVASSGATGGGAAVDVSYEIVPGPASSVSTGGYGNGPYGQGLYGASAGSGSTLQPRLWYLDNYGQDLVATIRDAGIYYWTYANGLSVHAVTLASLGDGDTPTIAKFVVSAPSTQSLIAFGCNDIGAGIEDPMLIRWSAAGSATIWTPSVTAPAGFQRLSSGSEIITAKQTLGQIVVLTDETIYGMQYLGPPQVYSFTPLGQHVNVIGPNTAAALGANVVWMGFDNFFAYSGIVEELPCEVRDYVFTRLNLQQTYKYFAAINRSFDEVWWFYVSNLTSNVNQEIDSYVMYSFVEGVWVTGTLARTAWSDEQSPSPYPIATDPNGILYNQEFGTDANGTPLMAFVQSSEQSIQQGDKLGMVRRVIPDIYFRESPLNPNPPIQSASVQFLYRDSPNQPFTTTPQYVIQQNTTDLLYPRFRGRDIAIQISSNSLGTAWRVGLFRADVVVDGRR